MVFSCVGDYHDLTLYYWLSNTSMVHCFNAAVTGRNQNNPRSSTYLSTMGKERDTEIRRNLGISCTEHHFEISSLPHFLHLVSIDFSLYQIPSNHQERQQDDSISEGDDVNGRSIVRGNSAVLPATKYYPKPSSLPYLASMVFSYNLINIFEYSYHSKVFSTTHQ